MPVGFVALIGLSLPVPIAFDVLAAGILYGAGMPVEYVMVLLFTLGIFSIYAFGIVWNAIAKRMAVSISVVLVVLGVVGGLAAHQYFKIDAERQENLFLDTFAVGRGVGNAPKVLRLGGEQQRRRLSSEHSRYRFRADQVVDQIHLLGKISLICAFYESWCQTHEPDSRVSHL